MVKFALIHSPLVGPFTWRAVAALLPSALVPTLSDSGDGPFWRRHAESAARAIGNERVVLVGHSGAGPILPAIAERLTAPAAGYIFVDAGLPMDGMSRLALMAEEDAGFAKGFGDYLNEGGRYPNWADDDLRGHIPDDDARRHLLAEISPRNLSFFSEPISVSAGWPDAPCAYVRLSSAYDKPFAGAQALGWPTRRFEAQHFHMLVEPDAIARAISDLAAEMPVR